MAKRRKPQSVYERIREGMRTIGDMARSLKKKKAEPPPVDTGRVRRRPVRPEPSPEQAEYLRKQREKDRKK